MLLVAAIVLALSGCGGGELRRAGDPHPSPATLAEAQEIDAAQRLLEDGQFEQARVELDAMYARGNRHPQALMLQARLAFRQNEWARAVQWCDRAVAASPLWVEPRVMLAQAQLKLERHAAAMSAFEDLDRIAPDSPWGPYGMGTIAAVRGDQATAARELERALTRDAAHAPSLESRAGLARLQGDHATEERMLSRYVASEPLDAFAHVRLGQLARMHDRTEEARRAFERAWSLAPLPEAARQLAELARARGDHAEDRQWSHRAGLARAAAEPEAQ